LRARTRACGALFVLDEVITGFRVAAGGVQDRQAIEPDLTVLGKVLGGGLPLAAVAGAAALMERLAPSGDTYQAGTLSGNPIATAAGLATLRNLPPGAYAKLERTTARLAQGLREAADRCGVPVQCVFDCGLLTVFFSDQPVRSYEDAKQADGLAYRRFFASMLGQGVYLPPSPFEAWFPSLAHSEEHVDHTIEAAARAFRAALEE
jgi:glutamate-1-semialdehyde 2,1-aminomutase